MQKILLVFILAILLVHTLANTFFWYITIPWIDIPMHIAGGAWLALLFFYIFDRRFPSIDSRKRFANFLFALGFVALIGAAWEMFEYFSGAFVARQFAFGGGRADFHFDSLLDLFDDVLGGAIASAVYLIAKKRS